MPLKSQPTPARSATEKFSCSNSNRFTAFAPARPARTRYKGDTIMKRLISVLALAGAFCFAGALPALAQDKAAEKPAAEAPAAAAPAAAPASAAAAPAAASATPAPTPNKGDTAWMLTSTALVLLMSVPALALFYGGMVRSKNMLSMLMQVFVVFSLITVLWCVYGYSLAFTEGNAFFGS